MQTNNTRVVLKSTSCYILPELLLYKEDIVKYLFEFFNIFDISLLDIAITQKNIRNKFFNLIYKLKFFDFGNKILVVEKNFVRWFSSRRLNTKKLSYPLLFCHRESKKPFIKNLRDIIDLDTTGFEWKEIKQLITHNPIKNLILYVENLYDELCESKADIITHFFEITQYLENLDSIEINFEEYDDYNYTFLIDLGKYCPKLITVKLLYATLLDKDTFVKILLQCKNLEKIVINDNEVITNDELLNSFKICKNLKEISINQICIKPQLDV